MKLQSTTITNFKRFSELTIRNIPPTTRLIMLIGPNGCGKSSLLDAFKTWHHNIKFPHHGANWQRDYHSKVSLLADQFTNQVNVEFHEQLPLDGNEKKKVFYIRSAYRNDPEFRIQQLTRIGSSLDEETVQRMIDNDAVVSKNYIRMVAQSLDGLYDLQHDNMTVPELREQILGEIRDALKRVLPDIEINSLEHPLDDGTFRFTKGISREFEFKNLSGGEKAAFDLILDIVIRRREFDNTIFCIDEPESHMNTRLQAGLLSALYDLMPQKCQLFLATHSIGMIRRALDIEKESPQSVIFLDFGDRNFDFPQVIEPTKPNRRFWHQVYQVALDDLATLVAPSRVIICEGNPAMSQPSRNHNHDAKCFDTIFGDEYPETRFISMGNDQQILGDQRGLAEALQLLIKDIQVIRLIDRDDRTSETIAEERPKGVRVLSRRNLESYLFDNEVLAALTESVDQADKISTLLENKAKVLASIGERAPDDLKPATGQIYNACKKILGLTQCGNNVMEFARQTLAPLVKPGMSVYDELRTDIFG